MLSDFFGGESRCLEMRDAGGLAIAQGDAALIAAIVGLLEGRILAISGTGGFTLCCLASNTRAVAALRERKRTERPFVVLVPSLEDARSWCVLADREAELLESTERPVVICERGIVAAGDGIAPRRTSIAVQLPDSPLLLALVRQTGALVVTSGNRSGEAAAAGNAEAMERLRWIADLFLLDDRAVSHPCESTIARVVAGRTMLLRRAHGRVSSALRVPWPVLEPILSISGVESEAHARSAEPMPISPRR